MPLGLDHLPLDPGGGEGPAGAGRLADHVAGLPQPGAAQGRRAEPGVSGADEQGLGARARLRRGRPAGRPGILGPLYTAIGTRIHNQKRRDDPELLPEALKEAGLPAELASAADSSEFDQQIKDSHNEAFDAVGTDVGTPVVRIRGQAIFGPVITPAPRGEAAGRLWDGVSLVTEADGFFELKRTRDRRPTFE